MADATPIKIDALLAKVETTYGTDPTPATSANEIRVNDRIWTNLTIAHQFENLRDDAATGTLSPPATGAKRGRIGTLTIPVELTGSRSGNAYSASNLPPLSPLIKSCGMSQAIVTTSMSETVTYSEANSSLSSCTIWAYSGNKLIKMTGCRGNIRWPILAGQLGTVMFEMTGMVSGITESSVASASYTSSVPPAAVGMSLTVGSWSPDVMEAEFDLGNSVVVVPSGNGSDGIAQVQISRRTPTWTLRAKAPAISTYDPWTIARTPTTAAIALTVGSTQYNRADLAVTASYLNDPEMEDQDGLAGLRLVYRCVTPTIVFD